MGKCSYCGRSVNIPYHCQRCGKLFCDEHRLPEYHNCVRNQKNSQPHFQRNTCYYCGENVSLPFFCRRCKKYFCSDHRLPEYHNCIKTYEEPHNYNKYPDFTSKYKPIPQYEPKKAKSVRSEKIKKTSYKRKKPKKTQDLIGVTIGILIFIAIFSLLHYTEVVKLGASIPVIANPTAALQKSPVMNSYPYYYNEKRSISFTTYGGLADYLSLEDHSYREDPVNEVYMELLNNPIQDEYLAPFIDSIKKTSSNPNDQAKVVISLVQHIPYDWSKLYGIKMDWYYPYETLYQNKGVCADKSLLMAYLLNKLEFDTVLFEFSDHMAVGVKCDPVYDFYDTGYAFIETTSPTIITYIPTKYLGGFQINSDFKTIHLKGGTRLLELSSESSDAIEYKKILAKGMGLDQYNYQRWQFLTTKYDLQYIT